VTNPNKGKLPHKCKINVKIPFEKIKKMTTIILEYEENHFFSK
jgi:hypothetical protein